MLVKLYSYDYKDGVYYIFKYNIVTHETEVLGKVLSIDDAKRIIEELNINCPPVDIPL